MDAFLRLSTDDRQVLCESAADELGVSAAAVEKDFWICWVLRELFALDDVGAHLTFKGGTSLSKGWALIERFSEDVDVVIDRDLLGFGGAKAPEAATTGNQRELRLDELKEKCAQYVRDTLLPLLKVRFERSLPKAIGWKITEDLEEPDLQTLLFEYSSLRDASSYLRPVVKIELGARSDSEPSSAPMISPYVARVPLHGLGECSFAVRTLAPERTFWEKAMLLHEETFRGSGPKDRLSRHYYDLWCLQNKGVADRAISDDQLFQRVVDHRAVFFRRTKTARDAMKRGTIQLVPADDVIGQWKSDYASMQETMFFGETPSFDDILEVAADLEERINRTEMTPR